VPRGPCSGQAWGPGYKGGPQVHTDHASCLSVRSSPSHTHTHTHTFSHSLSLFLSLSAPDDVGVAQLLEQRDLSYGRAWHALGRPPRCTSGTDAHTQPAALVRGHGGSTEVLGARNRWRRASMCHARRGPPHLPRRTTTAAHVRCLSVRVCLSVSLSHTLCVRRGTSSSLSRRMRLRATISFVSRFCALYTIP
jgi:hypothetical protein